VGRVSYKLEEGGYEGRIMRDGERGEMKEGGRRLRVEVRERERRGEEEEKKGYEI
jgi:hypothetical protein